MVITPKAMIANPPRVTSKGRLARSRLPKSVAPAPKRTKMVARPKKKETVMAAISRFPDWKVKAK
jgi:hypothetical protein